MWRRLAGAVAGLLVLFVGSLAFNAASGQSRWPGPLDFVRVHPWVVLLLLIPLSLIGLWQAPRRDPAQDPLAPAAPIPRPRKHSLWSTVCVDDAARVRSEPEQRRDLGRSEVVDPAMKKISVLAAVTMTGLALATPAHADNGNNPGGHINVSHRSPLATGLCKEALALVPVFAAGTDQAVDDACNNRDHDDLRS